MAEGSPLEKDALHFVGNRESVTYLNLVDARCSYLGLDFTSVLYAIAGRYIASAANVRESLGNSLFSGDAPVQKRLGVQQKTIPPRFLEERQPHQAAGARVKARGAHRVGGKARRSRGSSGD